MVDDKGKSRDAAKLDGDVVDSAKDKVAERRGLVMKVAVIGILMILGTSALGISLPQILIYIFLGSVFVLSFVAWVVTPLFAEGRQAQIVDKRGEQLKEELKEQPKEELRD